jgi:hypothetical protein
MLDFNLIPSVYQRRINLKRWIGLFLCFYICTVMALLLGRSWLLDRNESTQSKIAIVNSDMQNILSRKRELRGLHDERNLLTHQLTVLSGLIDGPRVQKLFYAIDRAINDDIWFVDWSFARAGELVEVNPERVHTGYFIIISEDPNSKTQKAWKIHTHTEITARAINHSALAEFVRQLGYQPEVERVRIVSTRTQKDGNTDVIDFKLAVVLSNSEEIG